mmetsp:Transcript_23797/g.34671  ORF Transcript_23797/g.34671 Transcript_23797/m.34671 type:complete len:93 (+) Transcript_23797:521-799(+)
MIHFSYKTHPCYKGKHEDFFSGVFIQKYVVNAAAFLFFLLGAVYCFRIEYGVFFTHHITNKNIQSKNSVPKYSKREQFKDWFIFSKNKSALV